MDDSAIQDQKALTREMLVQPPVHGRSSVQASVTHKNKIAIIEGRSDCSAESAAEALRSPWENAFAERLIGSVRRECLDHGVVLRQRHLRHLLKRYFAYYHRSRTHLALAKDAPEPRSIMRRGEIVAIPQLGGLHHRYERRAA